MIEIEDEEVDILVEFEWVSLSPLYDKSGALGMRIQNVPL